MNYFLLTLIQAFITSALCSVVLYDHLKFFIIEAISKNNENLDIIKSEVDTKFNDLENSNKNIIEKTNTIEKKTNEIDHLKKITSDIEQSSKHLFDTFENSAKEINDKKTEFEKVTSDIKNDFEKTKSEFEKKSQQLKGNSVNEYKLLKNVKNTKLIQIDKDNNIKRQNVDTHVLTISILAKKNIDFILSFKIQELYYINAYVVNETTKNISYIIPYSNIQIKEKNKIIINDDNIIENADNIIHCYINGIVDSYSM